MLPMIFDPVAGRMYAGEDVADWADPVWDEFGSETKPNSPYIEPSSLQIVAGLTTVFLVLFIIITLLRLYARARMLESGFRMDDGELNRNCHLSSQD